MQTLQELFTISYGTKLDFNKVSVSENKKNGISFVSRTSQNNGVVAKVDEIDWIAPLKKWQITVSLWGSYVLSAFLQEQNFYTAQNIAVIKPKIEYTWRELLFYCMCITKNRFRYWAFGREANSTLKDLLVPSKDEIPNRVYTAELPDYTDFKEPLTSKKLTLNIDQWKEFELWELFTIQGTKTTKKENLEEYWSGNFPYITTQSTNNWVGGFYDFFTEKWEVLTIDSAVGGFCSYQEKNFSASDHVEKLTPLFKINKYLGLFLTSLINKEQYRYNYGRKFNQERIKETKIKLPTDQSWNPDRNFMENYIKSLPYSKYL